jgi:nicotinamidase-related amidase
MPAVCLGPGVPPVPRPTDDKLDHVSALIVIDLQRGVAGLPAVHPMSGIVARSAQLARAFRERGLPVVLVNATGRAPGRTNAGNPKFSFSPDWTELVPELERHRDDYLRQRGVTQVVLTDVATSAGLESMSRSAYDLGYNVTLVLDAMTDREEDVHRHSIEKIFTRLGEIATTDRVLKLLMPHED